MNCDCSLIGRFVGDLSWFQVFVALVALANGGYTLYEVLSGPKINVFPGDRFNLVVSSGGGVSKIHLFLNLVNDAKATGTVHRIEVVARTPSNEEWLFPWNLFFEYGDGGDHVKKKSGPFPIAVKGKSSELVFAEFELASTDSNGPSLSWAEGKYDFELRVWVNQKDRRETPFVVSSFSARISGNLAHDLESERPHGPVTHSVLVSEWN